MTKLTQEVINDLNRKEEELRSRYPNLPPDKFDKEGNEIGLGDWTALKENREYCRVAEDWTDPLTWVSTVWTGLHMRYGNSCPLIFETMIFRNGSGKEEWHYSTEAEAVEGHQKVVKALMDGTI